MLSTACLADTCMDEENRNTEERENVANNPEGTGINGAPEGESEEGRTSTLDLQKLRKLRKGLRLTQAELAALLGIHRTYLVLIEKGKKIPSPRLERSILDFMDKAERDILSPQTLWKQVGHSNVTTLVSEPPARRAPVVSWAAAGVARAYEDLANQIEETVETECKDPNTFAIIIEGDSMENKFYAGDRVVFAPNSEPRNGDAVVAKLNDGRVFFKYFFRTGPEGSKVKLVSENQLYGPMEFDRGEFTFIYPAWEIKRKLRR
jgi:SOS-response transcriptional repressor LexA